MLVRKFTVITAGLLAAAAALLLAASAATAGGAGGHKLEGVWIAKSAGGQWTYVLTPDPSGRRASGHGSVEIGFSLDFLFGESDRPSPLLINLEMTGKDTGVYNCIWYGIRELPDLGPMTPTAELTYIGIVKGTLTFVGPGKMEGLHSFELYYPDQDGDGDGLPDPNEEPAFAFEAESIDTRLPSPR